MFGDFVYNDNNETLADEPAVPGAIDTVVAAAKVTANVVAATISAKLDKMPF